MNAMRSLFFSISSQEDTKIAWWLINPKLASCLSSFVEKAIYTHIHKCKCIVGNYLSIPSLISYYIFVEEIATTIRKNIYWNTHQPSRCKIKSRLDVYFVCLPRSTSGSLNLARSLKQIVKQHLLKAGDRISLAWRKDMSLCLTIFAKSSIVKQFTPLFLALGIVFIINSFTNYWPCCTCNFFQLLSCILCFLIILISQLSHL